MILCYHGVTERLGPDPQDRSAISVNRALFLAQLAYIRRRYRVISLREYLVRRENDQQLPPHSVILTFDDGPRNFLTVVAPILKDLGLPATVFLVTERVDSRGQSNMGPSWAPVDDQVSLSWSEAGTLQFAPGIEFGSHTCSHPELSRLNSSEIELELRDSLRAIRNNLHDSVPVSFAYPYGYYSELIAVKARSAGYSCALTTDSRLEFYQYGLVSIAPSRGSTLRHDRRVRCARFWACRLDANSSRFPPPNIPFLQPATRLAVAFALAELWFPTAAKQLVTFYSLRDCLSVILFIHKSRRRASKLEVAHR